MAMTVTEAKKELIRLMDAITQDTYTGKLYEEEVLKGMSDTQFMDWLRLLESGGERLVVIVPNDGPGDLVTENNLKIADEIGLEFFEKIIYTEEDGSTVKTPMESMVVTAWGRRLSQARDTKINVAKNDKSVDFLSGQPTAKSSGSRISPPEGKILAFLGLNESVQEHTNARGGDTGQYLALKSSLLNTGKASSRDIKQHSTGIQSLKVLRTFLLGINIGVLRQYRVEKGIKP